MLDSGLCGRFGNVHGRPSDCRTAEAPYSHSRERLGVGLEPWFWVLMGRDGRQRTLMVYMGGACQKLRRSVR